MYQVCCDGGNVKEYITNIITDNIYSQVDRKYLNQLNILEIADQRIGGTVVIGDKKFLNNSYSNMHRRNTTKIWDLLVMWNNSTSSWEQLEYLNGSNPEEVLDYAVVNKITSDPDFAWWTSNVLNKLYQIIEKNCRY